MNEKLIMMGQAKQMLSLGVWITIQLWKPKSALIVLYSILNETGPASSSNCWISRILRDDKSGEKETFLPITISLVFIVGVGSHILKLLFEKKIDYN